MVWLKSFKGKLSILGQLSPAEWALLGQAIAIFPIVTVSLSWGGHEAHSIFVE